MPHLSIEYSPGLSEKVNIRELCAALHNAMIEAGIFPTAGIRVRAYAADCAIVADGLPENNFAALTLVVGAGRSKEALTKAGTLIFATAEDALAMPLAAPHFALSLEIRVMDPELSWKNTPIHARLSGRG